MSRAKAQNICGIYLIRNTITHLCYIGQSSDVRYRWYGHVHSFKKNSERLDAGLQVSRRGNREMSHSWHKYGSDVFEFSVLEECPEEALTERETFWLKHFSDCLGMRVANSEGPVDNPMRGGKHKPEALAKISAAFKGKPKSEIHRRRIGDAHKGRVLPVEQREKLSKAKTGVPCPWLIGEQNPSCRPEARERLRGDANPAKRPEVRTAISERVRKPVVCEKTGTVWPSASVCAELLGVSVSAVSASIKRSRPCMGKMLSYVKDAA